jgi:hypothetical protein
VRLLTLLVLLASLTALAVTLQQDPDPIVEADEPAVFVCAALDCPTPPPPSSTVENRVKPSTTVNPAPPPEATDPPPTLEELTRFFALLALFDEIDRARNSVPPLLRVIRWCEAGSYIGLPFGETNYSAETHGYRGSSGGYQILRSTWLGWRSFHWLGDGYDRAVDAPDWIQDAVATEAFHRAGTRPWLASRGCWARYA